MARKKQNNAIEESSKGSYGRLQISCEKILTLRNICIKFTTIVNASVKLIRSSRACRL